MSNYNTKIEKKFLGDGAGYSNGYYGLNTTSYKSYRVQGLLTASKELTKDLQGSITLGAETNKDQVGDVINGSTNGGIPANDPFYFSLNNSVNKADISQVFRPSKLTDAIYTYGDITWRDMLTLSYSVRKDYNSTLTLANGTGD
jgi:iron complex outermembrane receptor protein